MFYALSLPSKEKPSCGHLDALRRRCLTGFCDFVIGALVGRQDASSLWRSSGSWPGGVFKGTSLRGRLERARIVLCHLSGKVLSCWAICQRFSFSFCPRKAIYDMDAMVGHITGKLRAARGLYETCTGDQYAALGLRGYSFLILQGGFFTQHRGLKHIRTLCWIRWWQDLFWLHLFLPTAGSIWCKVECVWTDLGQGICSV